MAEPTYEELLVSAAKEPCGHLQKWMSWQSALNDFPDEIDATPEWARYDRTRAACECLPCRAERKAKEAADDD